MKRVGVVASVAVLVGVVACERSMTITASFDNSAGWGVSCGELMHIVGKVTPATATPKVVLQQRLLADELARAARHRRKETASGDR